MARRPRLVVLARAPVPGAAKTRLIPVLGPEGAAETHRALTEHTLRRLRPVDACGEMELEVRIDGPPRAGRAWLGGSGTAWERVWFGRRVRCAPQGPGDLGERIGRSARSAFRAGAPKVVVVGSDCPDLTHHQVRRALRGLDRADVVLGPAEDGGYYLIGLGRHAEPALPRLLDVEWSTERVLRETLVAAASAGLRTALLEPLGDVDEPQDIPRWERVAEAEARPRRTISVIIPALEEADHVAAAVSSALPGAHEVIVADGGSRDATRVVAAEAGATVVGAPAGRASQMDAGARVATGDILLFLHADTRLPARFAEDVRAALASTGVVAAAFGFATDLPSAGMRVIERAASWRGRRLEMPYGDQALSVPADVFHALGGYPDLPVMEDYEFVRRLRRLGTVAIVPRAAVTSARSWAAHGIARTTIANRLTIWGHRLGVPPARLARLRGVMLGHGPRRDAYGLTAENDAQSV